MRMRMRRKFIVMSNCMNTNDALSARLEAAALECDRAEVDRAPAISTSPASSELACLLRTAAQALRARHKELAQKEALLEEACQLGMVYQLQCEQAVAESERLGEALSALQKRLQEAERQLHLTSSGTADGTASHSPPASMFKSAPRVVTAPFALTCATALPQSPVHRSSAPLLPVPADGNLSSHRHALFMGGTSACVSGGGSAAESTAKDVFMTAGVRSRSSSLVSSASSSSAAGASALSSLRALTPLEVSLLPQPIPNAATMQTACQLLPPGFVSITNLELGDILLLQSGGAVALAQATSRVFSAGASLDGSPRSVHAALVVSKDNATGCVEIAHVIDAGVALDQLIDEPTAHFYRAVAYRLRVHSEVAAAAVQHALDMARSRRIRFDSAGSVRSVFRELRANEYLPRSAFDYQVKSKRRAQLEMEASTAWHDEIGAMRMYRMFCSEFVACAYQEALMGLCADLRTTEDATRAELYRLMNLDPQSCPPMALEGYLLANSKTHGDWQPQGLCSFNIW